MGNRYDDDQRRYDHQRWDAEDRRKAAEIRDIWTRSESGLGVWIAQGLDPPTEIDVPESDLKDADAVLAWANTFLLGKDESSYYKALDFVDYARALALSPADEAEAYRIKARANAKLKMFTSAVMAAERALELDPNGSSVSAADIKDKLEFWRLRAEDE